MIPVFSIFFILTILIAVILSMEDISIWVIGIVFIYRILKRCNNDTLSTGNKLKYSIVNTLIPILSIFILNKLFVIGTKLILG